MLYLACVEFEEFNFMFASQVRWMHSSLDLRGSVNWRSSRMMEGNLHSQQGVFVLCVVR